LLELVRRGAAAIGGTALVDMCEDTSLSSQHDSNSSLIRERLVEIVMGSVVDVVVVVADSGVATVSAFIPLNCASEDADSLLVVFVLCVASVCELVWL
jgi:hypothetical protein